LAETRAQLVTVGNNLALANTPDIFKQVSNIFSDLTANERQLAADVTAREQHMPPVVDPQTQVDAAMEVVFSLSQLTQNLDDMTSASKAFETVNARLFFRFGDATWGKRNVRKMTGGVLTFGEEPPPIKPYQGPTARWAVKGSVDTAKKV
jgi:hypothetical protein